MLDTTTPRRMTIAEWRAEAERRFGVDPDPHRWMFLCPVCGHVATMADFKVLGADPQAAYQECIGRRMKSCARDFASKPAGDGTKSPCDYAAYGLFRSGYTVVAEDGIQEVPVLPFAEAA